MFRAPGFSHPMRRRRCVALALRLRLRWRRTCARSRSTVWACRWRSPVRRCSVRRSVAVSLLYDGAYYAGRTIDDYVGVRGSVPNANVTSAQAFGLPSSVSWPVVLLLDGCRTGGAGNCGQFRIMIALGGAIRWPWAAFAAALPETIVRAALLIAAPALAVALTVQVALAAVARVVPRLSSFSRVPGGVCRGDRRDADGHPAVCAAVRAAMAGVAVRGGPMSEESAEKRFDATPSRRERAKREGNAARSHEVASIAGFGGALLGLRPRPCCRQRRADRCERCLVALALWPPACAAVLDVLLSHKAAGCGLRR